MQNIKPGIQRVQALANTVSTSTRWHFTFTLHCHSNETRAPTANPPNSAQLGVTPLPFLQVTSGSVQ